MPFYQYFLALLAIFMAFPTASSGVPTNPLAPVSNDQEAVNFCTNITNSYVAIIWPRGENHREYIIKTLSQNGQVAYVKEFKLSKSGSFLLYRGLHPRMSLPTALKYFKYYIPARAIEPITISAIIFCTDKPLAEIQAIKNDIRATIGCGYQSIHINDYHAQTIEAAEIVFDNKQLKRFNK